MAKKPITSLLEFKDYYIPVLHFKEYRASTRFSITKKGLVIRSPIFSKMQTTTAQAISWCKNLSTTKPGALGNFKIKTYSSGSTIVVMGLCFKINISEEATEKDVISWKKDNIDIVLNKNYTPYQKSKVIGKLLSTFAAKRFITPIRTKVHALNQKHFKVEINTIRLKHNRTNWGSCSSKGNINLSTRLLLAPESVIDYVIIHELAHRIELNHSSQFWKLVADRCPDYKNKEKWLKENSHLCEY